MNMTLLWAFIAYFAGTILLNGIIAFSSKKKIKSIIEKYPAVLENIVDPQYLSLVKKGYFIQVIDTEKLEQSSTKDLADQVRRLLPLTYLSYALMAGLLVFLIIIVILMPAKTAL